jgi:hypothetical protein
MASRRTSRWALFGIFAALALGLWLGKDTVSADDKKPRYPAAPSADNVKMIPDAWAKAPRTPLTAKEIDDLLALARKNEKAPSAPLTTDEQFLRRVSLDVCGRPPTVEQIQEFLADPDPTKRSKLIDRLLDSDEFARHWGRYLRDVLIWRATDMRIVIRLPRTVALEQWLTNQLKANRSWASITRELLTSDKGLQHRKFVGGESAFLLAHTGEDAAVERAADTSRVFLGMRIGCAQCHDHPEDIWKRQQFHELAAFFARTSDKSTRNPEGGVIELVGLPEGEYQMPDLADVTKTHTIHPRFLTGETVAQGLSDADRRKTLADLITSKENYWFAAAFVNRVWGALMGQSFYQPVDNMGPKPEATYPEVLVRLADGFRATDHDIKALFRVILNSKAYQREFRLGQSIDEHVNFAGMYPARLSGETLWQSLFAALGPFPGDMSEDGRVFRGGGGVTAGPFSSANPPLTYLIKLLFDYDPSLKSDEMEASITQAMMLMNNKKINARIRATGDTPLAELLAAHQKDDSAIEILYRKTLSRKPSPLELETCRDYVKDLGKRGEAFEDILWALVNSTEFHTKR